MALSREITLTIDNYNITLDKEIKIYEYDAINLCFTIQEYGIVMRDGKAHNRVMPVVALKAYMLIETPQGVDSVEATNIVRNKVIFSLGNKYSQFVGVGKMQIILRDLDGCRITLPEFTYEVKQSINTGWEMPDVLIGEKDFVITDELGRPVETTKISEMDEVNEVTPQTYTVVINEDGNKKIKLDTIMKPINETIDEMIEVYDDEEIEVEFPSLHNDVERIKGEINEISESLEAMENNKVISETGKIGILYAGVIRNSGDGWKYIDDGVHNNINFKTIEETENNEIKVTYTDSKKIGSMLVGTDEFLASKGVTCGASVGDYQALIKCYAPFNGSIDGNGVLSINNNEWFQNTHSAIKLSDGTGFEITYDGADNIRETVNANVIRSGNTTITHSGLNVFISRDTINKVTLRAYSDLYAHIGYDGTKWNVTSSCSANITAKWENNNLIISHDSTPTYANYNLFQSVNVNTRIPLSGTPVNAYIVSVNQSSLTIAFYDINGNKINTPNTNMRVFINRPGFKVPHIWIESMRCEFNLGRTIVRPKQFVSNSGNLWLIGLHHAN